MVASISNSKRRSPPTSYCGILIMMLLLGFIVSPPWTDLSSSQQTQQLEKEKQELLQKIQSYEGQVRVLNATVKKLLTEKEQLQKQLRECSNVQDDSSICNLSTNLQHLQTKKSDYPRQFVYGPMQADEMLSIFSIVRTSFVRRVLEVGGFKGDSAYNFLEALRCKTTGSHVYTVDIRDTVKKWEHVVPHTTMVKDASLLTLDDLGGEPVDALLLDCHAFNSTQRVVRHVLKNHLLSRNAIIFLHDTGLHPSSTKQQKEVLNKDSPGIVHQPVERLIAQWIQQEDCAFQRISLHDDDRLPFRHGLTIMQRRVNLNVNDCGKGIYRYADYEPHECEEIQKATLVLNESCPVF